MQCVVCMCELTTSDKVDLECGHAFHLSCIRNWFAVNPSCPLCKSHGPTDNAIRLKAGLFKWLGSVNIFALDAQQMVKDIADKSDELGRSNISRKERAKLKRTIKKKQKLLLLRSWKRLMEPLVFAVDPGAEEADTVVIET